MKALLQLFADKRVSGSVGGDPIDCFWRFMPPLLSAIEGRGARHGAGGGSAHLPVPASRSFLRSIPGSAVAGDQTIRFIETERGPSVAASL